jgi:DNA transformation protein
MTKNSLESLPNIGKNLAEKLNQSGIDSLQSFEKLKTEEIFLALKSEYPDACLNTLYAIEGAKQNIRWHQIDKPRKKDLLAFFDEIGS